MNFFTNALLTTAVFTASNLAFVNSAIGASRESTAVTAELERSIKAALNAKAPAGKCRVAHARLMPGLFIRDSTFSIAVRKFNKGAQVKVASRGNTGTLLTWLMDRGSFPRCLFVSHEGRGH